VPTELPPAAVGTGAVAVPSRNIAHAFGAGAVWATFHPFWYPLVLPVHAERATLGRTGGSHVRHGRPEGTGLQLRTLADVGDHRVAMQLADLAPRPAKSPGAI